MALRDQPYLPLYVQDFLTDERLNECSAQSVGVYIKIMCVLHKSEEYGTILLKQKDKQNDQQLVNFAYKFVKHLSFQYEVILSALIELVDEGVLHIEGDKLYQKRMVKDNDISLKRSSAGAKGGFATSFAKANYTAKDVANTENENENESIDNKKVSIEVREANFTTDATTINQLENILSKDELKKFVDYWTESSGVKMRFEKEKTFDLKRRLIRWRDNQIEFNRKAGQQPPQKPKTENLPFASLTPEEAEMWRNAK